MPRVCLHLNATNEWWGYAKSFSGLGTEYALVCTACSAFPETIEASLRSVSIERFAQIEENGDWEPGRNAILGKPQVLERPEPLSFRHAEIAQAGSLPGTISDLKPMATSRSAACLILTDEGDVLVIRPHERSLRRLLNVHEVSPTLTPRLSLGVSPLGDMAAIVEARGRRGFVVNLESGRKTMDMDRGDYHPEQTEFPSAFFESGGQLRLVHGTGWNRLDISDPRTGLKFTDRSPTSYERGEARPEHYLDYFHGELSVSPGGERIVDNGWAWHPVGGVAIWSLGRWAEENRWESEDGPSRQVLCWRDYYWGGPLCWVDDRMLAVWGYGNYVENLIPAAQIFDTQTGRLIRWFAGPVGTFAFDRYLFSSSPEAGTSVWDIASGERVLHDAAFNPTCFHPGTREFITLTTSGGLRLSRLVEA